MVSQRDADREGGDQSFLQGKVHIDPIFANRIRLIDDFLKEENGWKEKREWEKGKSY